MVDFLAKYVAEGTRVLVECRVIFLLAGRQLKELAIYLARLTCQVDEFQIENGVVRGTQMAFSRRAGASPKGQFTKAMPDSSVWGLDVRSAVGKFLHAEWSRCSRRPPCGIH